MYIYDSTVPDTVTILEMTTPNGITTVILRVIQTTVM